MNTSRFSIGHVPFDKITVPQILSSIDRLITSRRGGFIVTPNIDHIVMAQSDGRLRDAYRHARLSLPDGQPVVWMARLLGAGAVQKVSGSDLLDPLMAHAAAQSHPVFFFGASPEASAEAARRLQQRYPTLQIAGRDTSFLSSDDTTRPEDSPVDHAIRASGARIVVVAMGAPKQELWMARHAEALRPAVLLGLGASLDFVAGTVTRAPKWISDAGFEWLYRLAQEPRRLAYRYLVRDLNIVPILARQLVFRKG